MPFEEGKSGNPLGKPVGTKSKKTVEWEEFGRNLLEYGLPRAMEIMQDADNDKFMFYFGNLIEYFKPKLARTTLVGDNQNPIQVRSWTIEPVKPTDESK